MTADWHHADGMGEVLEYYPQPLGTRPTKRANILPSMVASSRVSVSETCSVTKEEWEDHLNRAGSGSYRVVRSAKSLRNMVLLRSDTVAAISSCKRRFLVRPSRSLCPIMRKYALEHCNPSFANQGSHGRCLKSNPVIA